MKLAICGSAPSSVRQAPFNGPSYAAWQQGKVQSYPPHIGEEWEIWGCSPGLFGVAPRATRWFEVHRWEVGQPWFSPEYVEFLKNFKGPVYTGGTIPEIKNHVVYPIDELEAEFSAYFMSSSLSLMMALAIRDIEQTRKARRARKAALAVANGEGAKTGDTVTACLPAFVNESELDKPDSDDVIGMWGVDMSATEEYGYQRPGCQFFVLEAMRRGIGVYLPPESDLMRPMPVYGISEWDHNYIKLTTRSREINSMMQEANRLAQENTQRMQTLAGEQHMLDFFVKTWTCPYGMEHGMVIHQAPGTGLGSGITHIDTRPVERMVLGQPKAAPVDRIVQDPPVVNMDNDK